MFWLPSVSLSPVLSSSETRARCVLLVPARCPGRGQTHLVPHLCSGVVLCGRVGSKTCLFRKVNINWATLLKPPRARKGKWPLIELRPIKSTTPREKKGRSGDVNWPCRWAQMTSWKELLGGFTEDDKKRQELCRVRGRTGRRARKFVSREALLWFPLDLFWTSYISPVFMFAIRLYSPLLLCSVFFIYIFCSFFFMGLGSLFTLLAYRRLNLIIIFRNGGVESWVRLREVKSKRRRKLRSVE